MHLHKYQEENNMSTKEKDLESPKEAIVNRVFVCRASVVMF